MSRSTTFSVVLLVSAIFTGCMLSAHAARTADERAAAASSAQASCEDGAEQAGYWQIWAAATAQ